MRICLKECVANAHLPQSLFWQQITYVPVINKVHLVPSQGTKRLPFLTLA